MHSELPADNDVPVRLRDVIKVYIKYRRSCARLQRSTPSSDGTELSCLAIGAEDDVSPVRDTQAAGVSCIYVHSRLTLTGILTEAHSPSVNVN